MLYKYGVVPMPVTQPSFTLTPQAYLEWEKDNEIKHEFVDGDVFAMAGAKDAHVTVAGNLFALLHAHVKGSPCRPYISDMKVQVEKANAFFYPDVMITCDERDRHKDYFKNHPILIAEILSESTAAFDRGRKFAAYRQLESLQEYLLIDPNDYSVDCFRRDTAGHWVLYPFGSGEQVELASLKWSAPIAALYEGVTVNPRSLSEEAER